MFEIDFFNQIREEIKNYLNVLSKIFHKRDYLV